MVHVTLKEIEDAFKNHRKKSATSSEKLSITDKMILFYAVECGLKALYMRQNRLKRTDGKNNSGESVSDFGHNLNELLNKIKLNYKVSKITAKDGSQIEQNHLHEAWRYGKTLNEKQEKSCLELLNKILNELKNHLDK